MKRSRPWRTNPLVLLAACLVTAACGSADTGSLELGVRRIALDIAFVDEDAAPPAEPDVIVRLVPAPPEVLEPGFDFATIEAPEPEEPAPPPLPPVELCPTAPPEETVDLPASPAVIDPVEPGTYPRDNAGSITITGASVPLQLPYPFLTTWQVGEAAEVEKAATALDPTAATAPKVTRFTITKDIGPGFQTVETFEIGEEALLLIERVTIANGTETRFRTDPPLEYFRYGAEGDTWNSAGADLENGYGVVIQGSIDDREVIDVCGDLVDTFVIAYTEQVVNLANGAVSGTSADEPSTIFFAPQYGGLAVREDMHTTQRSELEDGTPVIIEYDYVSTLTSIEPQ